jgi:hypothetical protein
MPTYRAKPLASVISLTNGLLVMVILDKSFM